MATILQHPIATSFIYPFLLVFFIVFALLEKTKLLGENMFTNLLIGFIVAIIFTTMSSAQEYVETITPWFAVLLVALFFILVLIGLSQQKIADIMKPGMVWVFLVALILIFLISFLVKDKSSKTLSVALLLYDAKTKFARL